MQAFDTLLCKELTFEGLITILKANCIFLSLLLMALLPTDLGISEWVGVCYGRLGNNLPSIPDVVNHYRSNNINRMRIYDPNHSVLNALRGSNIELILGVPNEDLQSLTDPGKAATWVLTNVVPFWPSVRFKYIAVGNEVSPIHAREQAEFVCTALVNVYNAVRDAGLHEQIMVSTAVDMTDLLEKHSYPPSEGAFRDDVRWFVNPIIGHLVWAKTPLLANIHTYFSHVENPTEFSLPYALFTSPSVVVWDKGRGYQNLFVAMLDALYSALEGAWGGSLDVVVSETGWPSAGGGFATSFENAETYLSSVIRHVKDGTPKRPNKPIETYLFAMFNENQKELELEKSFGLFFPNRTPKYNIGLGGERRLDILSAENNSTTVELASDMYVRIRNYFSSRVHGKCVVL